MSRVVATILSGAGARLVPVSVYVEPEAEATFVVVGLDWVSTGALHARLRAALLSSGLSWPSGAVVVDADLAGRGVWDRGLDLAVALGTLGADGQLDGAAVERWVAIGGLRLDGRVDRVAGVLARLQAAAGLPVVLPAEALRGIAPVVAPGAVGEPADGLLGARDLRSLVATLRDEASRPAPRAPLLGRLVADRRERERIEEGRIEPDLADVAGEARGRWALEVAAAGGHHLLLFGPPGAGKTTLAERLAGLLPDLPPAWAAEVAGVASAADGSRALRPAPSRAMRPPVQRVGPMTPRAVLAGGSGPTGRPGCVSLAHRGILVAEDLELWDRRLLLVLREALDRGELEVAHGSETLLLPARFHLVATVTTSPAGLPGWTASAEPAPPSHTAGLRAGLVDRFDLVVAVASSAPVLIGAGPVRIGEGGSGEATAVVAARVAAARQRSRARQVALGLSDDREGENGRLAGVALRALAPLAPGATRLLRSWLSSGEIGVRGALSLQRVARTIADLTGDEERLSADHLVAARALRQVERASVRR